MQKRFIENLKEGLTLLVEKTPRLNKARYLVDFSALDFVLDIYNPQNETCDALRTKRAKIKTKRFSISKRSVLLRRFPGYPFFKKISTRLRRDLTASRLSI